MKAGRPKKKDYERKDYKITVRLTKAEYEALIQYCLEKHLTINEHIRSLMSSKRSEDRRMSG